MLLTDLLGDRPPARRQRRLARTIAAVCVVSACVGYALPVGWFLP